VELGEIEEAEKMLRHAVALAPESSAAHNNLGAALDFKGARTGAGLNGANLMGANLKNATVDLAILCKTLTPCGEDNSGCGK
jgi:Flp pilus assembly protein TadD